MSGVAGGSRIQRQDVQKTFNSYVTRVLQNVEGFKKATLSGSVNAGTKPDFGDLDLIVSITGTDKKEVKQRLINIVTSLPDTIIVPFKSDKYKGKKYYNAGELISVLYPIEGREGEYIQVDNIIALSEEEHQFKNNFLDLPAEKQGLLIGLAKVILLERKPVEIFKKLGINIPLTLNPNQEYEFNLSSVKLSLRRVELDSNYREVSREEVWSTTDWNTIKTLFDGYNITGTFEELLNDLARSLKNPRSKQRIKGIFKSMVTVKSGEIGTAKGDTKEKALAAVDRVLNEDTSEQVVALYAGGFKPPHKGHFENAKKLLEVADKLIVFIGPKQREGLEITAEQSAEIWKIYAKHLKKPLEIQLSAVTPIRDLYEWAEDHNSDTLKIVTGSTKDDFSRFKALVKDKEKYPNVELVEFSVTTSQEDSKLSATNIRTSEEYLKSGEWLPDQLTEADIRQVVNILLPVLESQFSSEINKVLQNFYNATESLSEILTTPEDTQDTKQKVVAIEPSEISKPSGITLDELHSRVVNMLGSSFYNINKLSDRIEIRLKSEVLDDALITDSIVSILTYGLQRKQISLRNVPEIKIINNYLETADLFRPTATYTPNTAEIKLHVAGRHAKDILRSFCHELIHHIQKEEGRLLSVKTTDTTASRELEELEKEAYLRGNLLFRNWEDSMKNRNNEY